MSFLIKVLKGEKILIGELGGLYYVVIINGLDLGFWIFRYKFLRVFMFKLFCMVKLIEFFI